MNFKKAWNNRKVSDRVKLSRAAGLEGKRGSAAWEDLSQEDRERLTNTIIYLSDHFKKRYRAISKRTAARLGVSRQYIESQPIWIQEGRAPTYDEFKNWSRSQHEKACQFYEPAWPLNHHNGQCHHYLCNRKKPCTSFYAHTGICETGEFVPDKIKIIKWSDFQKQFRKANRRVKKQLEG